MKSWDDERLLVKVAQMYYYNNMSQSEISKRLGIYRTTISRMLKKARESGIVTIHINSKFNYCYELEDKLESEFNLKECIVVPENTVEGESGKRLAAKAGADFLKRIVKDGDNVGFAWGSTIAYLSDELKNCRPTSINVVPLVGGPGNIVSDYHVNTIISKVAKAFNCKAHYLYAPAITEKKETKEAIISDSNFRSILKLWDKVNIAVVGIGSPAKSSNMIWMGFFENEDFTYLEKENVVGDICSRFYDINGKLIESDINDRTIAIELEKLRDMEYSIGIAESLGKVPAILGALRGRYINTLITTEGTAKLLLDFNK
ncbi:sugar-binding transcriptional regulator [Tepidimicrobium xylanilyticum]|uniref:sugar-binding transcriptional regulator n=1 Tax=Tepidimicrobium xylanilyticum TaxID=1123352 RepID=UPI00264BA3F1|nr:sugar-binding transcriptional regulator [Tepidimicrobium xylanilyticum]GMG95430.1 glucitol operon activator [Tepidimicrobium xylanilyticum]